MILVFVEPNQLSFVGFISIRLKLIRDKENIQKYSIEEK